MRKFYREFLANMGHSLSEDIGLWSSLRYGWRETWREHWRKPVPLSDEMRRMDEIITQTLHGHSSQFAHSIMKNNPHLRQSEREHNGR